MKKLTEDQLLKGRRYENEDRPLTVGQLIKILQTYNPDMSVKYTLGGSDNFGNITYVDTQYDCYNKYDEPEQKKFDKHYKIWNKDDGWVDRQTVIIGELSW